MVAAPPAVAAVGEQIPPFRVSQVRCRRVGSMIYSKTTRQITVSVTPVFLEDQSSPSDNHYVWAYQVRIENHGAATVRLRTRYWKITDSHGRVQEVRGAGVVGEQPVLHPGESFEYTSGTPLPTPSGIMVGSYQMQDEAGDLFDIAVPAFSLDSPHQPVRLH
jgi:ApaG protein